MRLRYLIMVMVTALASCSNDENTAVTPPVPEITSVNRQIVQSGDTLELTGKNLFGKTQPSEAYLGSRPTKIISASADKMLLLVPDKVLTGNIVLHIDGQTAIWPEIKVTGTPSVTASSSLSAFAGDTLVLTGENLTGDLTAINIWMDGQPVKITAVTNTTAKVIVPEGTGTHAIFSWQTYGRKIYKNETLKIGIRPSNINASSILEYLQKDPGMEVTYLAMDYMSTNPFHKGLHDTLRQYLDGTTPCIIFLPANEALNKMGIYTLEDVQRRGMDMSMLLNVVVKEVVTLDALVPDKLYPSEYTHFVYDYYGGDPSRHAHLVIREKDGEKYVAPTTNTSTDQPVWEAGTWVKVLRQHRCGNSIIFETESFVTVPYGVF